MRRKRASRRANPSSSALRPQTGLHRAPSYLLLHGTGTNRCSWDRVCASLPDGSCLAVDLPGHGARAAERFELDRAMRVVDDALSSLSRPVILVGWSLGGYVALAATSRRPGDVDGLVLVGCSMIPNAPLRLVLRTATLAAPIAETTLGRRLLATLARRSYGDRATASTLRCGIEPGNGLRAFGPLAGWDIGRWLDAVECPALVLNGAHDLVFRWQERAIARRLGHTRVATVRGEGHVAPLTAPGKVASLVHAFSRQAASAGSAPVGSPASAPDSTGSSG